MNTQGTFVVTLWTVFLILLHPGVSPAATNQETAQRLISTITVPYSFIVLGDSRNKSTAPGKGDKVLMAMIDYINAMQPRPAFVIHTGDYALKGLPVENKRFLKMLAKLEMPSLVLPGNHEVSTRVGKAFYYDHFGSGNVTFSIHGITYILLESYWAKGPKEYARRYLEEAIARISTPHAFIFMHVPPRLPLLRESVFFDQWRWFRGLVEIPAVKYIFCSHYHGYHEYRTESGNWYLISGGAGAGLKRGYFYHMIEVRVTEDTIGHRIIPFKKLLRPNLDRSYPRETLEKIRTLSRFSTRQLPKPIPGTPSRIQTPGDPSIRVVELASRCLIIFEKHMSRLIFPRAENAR